MRQDVVCPHCQKSFHVRPGSFLSMRLECPHCHARYKLSLSWIGCVLVAILAVLFSDKSLWEGMICFLIALFAVFYLFLPFWLQNDLIRIKPVKNKTDPTIKQES